jgi:hypothetical protein
LVLSSQCSLLERRFDSLAHGIAQAQVGERAFGDAQVLAL